MTKFTPGPYTTKPGRFFIAHVGGNADDPGVWSTAIPANGLSFPFGDKRADAALLAASWDLYTAGTALLDAAERHIFGDECLAEREAFRAALNKATTVSNGDPNDQHRPTTDA